MSAATSTLQASDDRRHAPSPGAQGRDSLFFNVIMPEHELGVFIYTWTDEAGVAGYQVSVWGGPDPEPTANEVVFGRPLGDADLDEWVIDGFELRNQEPLRTAQVRMRSDTIELDYEFEAIHDAYDYSSSPQGCPQWMATNRFEQTGRVRGELRVDGRTIAFDRLGHRDHSWGRRNWRMPQHWKWIVAQTDAGTGLHVFPWVAMGEPGVNGYVIREGRTIDVVAVDCDPVYDPDMIQRRLSATLTDAEGVTTALTMERFGNVLELPVGRSTVINEVPCSVTIDGEPGSGQFEVQWPMAYFEALREMQR